MAEYGQGVSTGTGAAGGIGGGGGTMDVGQQAANFVNDAVYTVSTLPPEALLVIAIAIIMGFILLRKAI
jgi:hypothetical protein